jgi:hypothetical protein
MAKDSAGCSWGIFSVGEVAHHHQVEVLMVILGIVLIVLGLLVASLHVLLIIGVILLVSGSYSILCPLVARVAATTDPPWVQGMPAGLATPHWPTNIAREDAS